MNDYFGMHGGMWLWICILFVFLILLAFGWRGGKDGSRGRRGGQTALEILKERYARGEISKKEFEEKKKDIS